MRPEQRQTRASFAISVALHVIFGGLLVRVITYTVPVDDFAHRRVASEPPSERVTFVAVPSHAAVTNPGRSGGDGRPATGTPRPPLRAPASVPSEIPPAAPAPNEPPPGSGEVVGAGGAEQGILPTYTGTRLWSPIAPYVGPPKSYAERLDSSLAARLRAHRDSMVAMTHVPTKMERGDWTVERNGQKFGIDQKYIHLGRFSLPTAALALLPLNRQANPIASEREARLNYMHADIQYQAQRAMNYDEFRNAVKAIRERKERERAAAREAETMAGRGAQ